MALTKNREFGAFPGVVRIEPASACNLRCSHCPTGTVDMKRGIMPQDIFNDVLDQLKSHVDRIRVVVLYHGGEPLLNKHFPEMVRRLKEIGIKRIKTVSNGMLLNIEKAKALIDSGLDEIEFSLDGDSIDTSNEVRRRSDANEVIRNVKAFINLKSAMSAAKPKVFLATTQFLKRTEIEQNSFPEETPVPAYLQDAFSTEIEKSLIEPIKSTYATQWPDMIIDPNQYSTILAPVERGGDSDYCDHVYNTLTVRSNGDVVACCYDLTSKYTLGNIQTESIENIWKNDRYNHIRSTIESKKYIDMCSNCSTVRRVSYLVRTVDM